MRAAHPHRANGQEKYSHMEIECSLVLTNHKAKNPVKRFNNDPGQEDVHCRQPAAEDKYAKRHRRQMLIML
jgi:hypothetical protein